MSLLIIWRNFLWADGGAVLFFQRQLISVSLTWSEWLNISLGKINKSLPTVPVDSGPVLPFRLSSELNERKTLVENNVSVHRNKIKLSRCGQDVTSIQQRSDGVQERLCVCVCVSQDWHELYLHFVERQIRLKAQKLNTQKKKVTYETCQEHIRLIFHLKIKR